MKWIAGWLGVVPAAMAQIMLTGSGGQVHPVGSDLAVLTTQDIRKEIDCTVSPVKPVLGFDFRFHGGFEVNIPLKDLAGTENNLTILFRVTPMDRLGDQGSQNFRTYLFRPALYRAYHCRRCVPAMRNSPVLSS